MDVRKNRGQKAGFMVRPLFLVKREREMTQDYPDTSSRKSGSIPSLSKGIHSGGVFIPSFSIGTHSAGYLYGHILIFS
jgi:hypothetical protein